MGLPGIRVSDAGVFDRLPTQPESGLVHTKSDQIDIPGALAEPAPSRKGAASESKTRPVSRCCSSQPNPRNYDFA